MAKWKRFPADKETTQAALECQIVSAAAALARLIGKPRRFCEALDVWGNEAMTKLMRQSQRRLAANRRKGVRK